MIFCYLNFTAWIFGNFRHRFRTGLISDCSLKSALSVLDCDRLSPLMPLYPNGVSLIRGNLIEIARGERVRIVAIGYLTQHQYDLLNEAKVASQMPRLGSPEIVFLGKHLYASRVERDGYTIDDLVVQITAALAQSSLPHVSARMTALKSTRPRTDGYGNDILDEAILELTARKPRAELYSVIPKGDRIRPKRQTK